MRAIKIDPRDQTVTEIDMAADDYRAFYPVLECDTFDIVRATGEDFGFYDPERADTAIDIYCDDEGLMRASPIAVTRFTDGPGGQGTLLAGVLVLMSSDDAGSTIALPDWLTVERARNVIDGFGLLVQRKE